MEWIGDYPKVALVPDGKDYTMYVVDEGGKLRISGKNWKMKRRTKRERELGYPKETERICYFDSPGQAMRIAEMVQEKVEKMTS